jgi:putative hydrolase of the HAD superfamily
MSESVGHMIGALHRSQREELIPIATDLSPVLTPIHPIRAVLFDIYGTLLISGSGDIGNAIETSRSSVFFRALEIADAAPRNPEIGVRAERLFLDSIAASHARSKESGIDYPEVDILEIWQTSLWSLKDAGMIGAEVTSGLCERVAVAYEVTANPVVLMPGAGEILQKLSRSGYIIGIVSNAQFFTPRLLEIELGASLSDIGFSLSLCSYSFQAGCAKPSKQIFAPALDRLRLDHSIRPEETLYVGNDMLNDIMTSAACGCRTCLFAGDKRSLRLRSDDTRCAATQPDGVVTDLGQIDHLLSEGTDELL